MYIDSQDIMNEKDSTVHISVAKKILAIGGVLFVFLLSLDLMVSGFSELGVSAAESIIYATSNPFISLFIGLLITALVQSSSASTSLFVAAVASGSLSMESAVPMVMGANIGTTITSTIVSLGFITKRNEFRKAIAAGTAHDFFNILTTIVLFPLEYFYGFLSGTAQAITSNLSSYIIIDQTQEGGFNLFESLPVDTYLSQVVDNPYIAIVLAFILLFASIKLMSKLIYKFVIGESKGRLRNYVFKKPIKSFAWGTGITALIQSSSVTTSLIVPLVATGKVKLKNAIPFILGANIGTTITAFIALLFDSSAALSIAITHLLFNMIGVFLFLPLAPLRNLLTTMANFLGRITINYRLAGFAYIILTFFLIPFTLIFFSKDNMKDKEAASITNTKVSIEVKQPSSEKATLIAISKD
ncbi:MAG: Na/Pi symporter [Bacteroidota bacterium]